MTRRSRPSSADQEVTTSETPPIRHTALARGASLYGGAASASVGWDVDTAGIHGRNHFLEEQAGSARYRGRRRLLGYSPKAMRRSSGSIL